MVYAIYKKSAAVDGYRYERVKAKVSLFGCKEGWIPWLLSRQVPPGQNERYCWHVDIATCDIEGRGNTFIIDLKPNSNPRSLSLYEICDVWGISDSDWTPIMLRLRALFVDTDPADIDETDFTRADLDVDEPIFSFLYLNGSVAAGKLTGRRTAPRASPTNSALLWPETFVHFQGVAQPFLRVADMKLPAGISAVSR